MKNSLPMGIITTQQPFPEVSIDAILKSIDSFKQNRERTDNMLRNAIHDLIIKGHSIYFVGSTLGLSYSQVLDAAYSLKPIPADVWNIIRVYCEKVKRGSN